MAGSHKIYKGVYLMKFIMAYFVVAIHTTDWSLMGLLEIAVPYFFIASGFFLFRKLGGSREEDLLVIRRWTFRVLKLYLVWTAVYLPFTVVGFLRDGLTLETSLMVFLRNFLFVGENYLSWPLWYLLALIWDGVLIYFMRWLRMPVWSMFLVGLVLYLSAEIFDIQSIPYYVKLFQRTGNGLFFGLAFVTSGGIVWQLVSSDKAGWPVLWEILLTIAVFVGFQFKQWLLLPLAVGVFLVSLRLYWPDNENTARRLGAMSKTIYLTHMIFAGLLILLAHMSDSMGLFAASAFAATIIAFLFSGQWKKTKVAHFLQLS